MGIKYLQEYLETHCSGACLSVDLLKISRSYIPKRRGRFPNNGRFCLIVDSESCLDRLYGGYFSDWVCGGQWNRMINFLENLMQACHNANMDLVVFFNGALESQKMDTWYAEQQSQKKKVNLVLRHIHNKGTPPPKVWWTPPVFLTGALRLALRQLGIGVAMSMDDHEQEVIGFCREHGLQGILGQNSAYAIFDPPRYFSCQNLKLTYKGSLETKEYIMDELAKALDLNPNRFCLFAALLGNHIVTEEDLYDFFKYLISVASKESGKVVKPTPENVTRAVVDYVRSLQDISNLEIIGEQIFSSTKTNKKELISKLKQSVQYYLNGTEEGFLRYNPRQSMPPNFSPQTMQNKETSGGYGEPRGPDPNRVSPETNWQASKPIVRTKVRGQEIELPPVSPDIMRIASERHQKGMMSPWIYQVLSQGEIKMTVTLEDENYREVPPSIEAFRPVRQTIYSVLLNLNKLKIVHETQSKDKVDSTGAAPKSFEVPIKEWVIHRTGSQKPSFNLVMARPVDWKTPSIERMWLGQLPDDKTRRLRAFLTIMHSDAPSMLNTSYVPQHLLMMCCVLRYLLHFGRVLQRQELDAFLAMSVSPLLHDVQTMQDLKLPSIQPRGVALAALFMAGLETALFANDVCGAPVAWNMICPWQFFDGKLFHYKLLKANNNTPLIDICDGQVDQVLRVEKMRQAIMENLKFEFAKPFLPQPLYPGYPPMPGMGHGPHGPYGPQQGPFSFRPAGMRGMPQGPGGPMGRGMGQLMGPMGLEGPPHNQGRGRGILGRSPVDGRGGQLEIAGVVVGSWGPNLSAGGRGRANNSLSPRVMSVGGPRSHMMPGFRAYRGGRGGMFYRGMPPRPMKGRGVPMPMYRMPPERQFYGYGPRPTRGVVRGTRRPAFRARPKQGIKNRRPPGRGRGMTVDSSNVGKSQEESEEEVEEEDDLGDGVGTFEDAIEGDGDGALSKQLMQNGLQSPDSGIHGDKSATELSLSA